MNKGYLLLEEELLATLTKALVHRISRVHQGSHLPISSIGPSPYRSTSPFSFQQSETALTHIQTKLEQRLALDKKMEGPQDLISMTVTGS